MHVGRQEQKQEQYKSKQEHYESKQSEAEGVSEEGMPEEHKVTTSSHNTDGHEQSKIHNAGKYFNASGRLRGG